jgi:hypothetical protein
MKISTIRATNNAYLDEQALIFGEEGDLTPENLETVTRGLDEINETNNPNLPERPH